MERIRFFRQNKVKTLWKKIKDNLSWYRSNDDVAISDLDEFEKMSLSIDTSCFDALNKNTSEDDDLKNVIVVYEAFNCLSPQQATEGRIWAYATHVWARQYTSERWKIPIKSDDAAVKYILTHYFVSGVRGLIRDNAVARLWWMGHIASRCEDYCLKDTLKILLRNADVRANLLERPSLSSSKEIFSGVIRMLGKSLNDGDDPAIYERENFRSLMKMLNRKGGRIMLNMLNKKQLDDVLNEMVEQVTGGAKTSRQGRQNR